MTPGKTESPQPRSPHARLSPVGLRVGRGFHSSSPGRQAIGRVFSQGSSGIGFPLLIPSKSFNSISSNASLAGSLGS